MIKNPERAGDLSWLSRGACVTSGVDPDMFSDDTRFSQALHVCQQHCEVRDRCTAEALRQPIGGTVFGAIAWSNPPHVYRLKIKPALLCELCAACPITPRLEEVAA